MRIFGFIFYKVYSFYNKHWPKHDPDIYAEAFIVLLLLSYIFSIFYNILELLHLKLLNINLFYFPIIIISFVFNYYTFFKDDKYLKYINKDLYQNKFYKSWQCELILTIIFVLPIILFFNYFLLAGRNR